MQRLALLSVHTSPLAPLGGKKTGGMNVYVRELAAELGRRGIFVDVYTRRASPDTPEIDISLGQNVRVIHINAGPAQPLDPNDIYPYIQRFTAGLVAFTTKHGVPAYDLVYSHYWLSGLVASKLKEMWGTPFVQMFHTLGHMKNRIETGQPMLPDMRTQVEMQIVSWAERVIAATPAERSQLLWLYRADPRKIVVVPPGVNLERFHPMPMTIAKSALGIDPAQKLLLFVGRIEPLKAVDTILHAVHLIKQEQLEALKGVRVAIIGGNAGNPELARLMALAARLEISDIVEFTGAKDQRLLATYYAAATAVMVPSDYESFGLVALEAMAAGTPVIASEVGGLQYLVRDGETGYLVPVREPAAMAARIVTLLSEPETQARLGHNAAQLAQAYSWSSIADQLLPLFDQLTTKRRRVRQS